MLVEKKSLSIKYKPTKKGKISLLIALVAFGVGILALLLSVLSIIPRYFILISVVCYLIIMLLFIVLLIDRLRFKKNNKLNKISSISEENIIYFILWITIGIIWCKIL